MNNYFIISFSFLLTSIFIISFGFSIRFRIKKIINNGIKTKGEIIKREKKKRKFLSGADENSSITFRYLIKYIDINQNVIINESDFEDQTKLNIGDTIELYYNKSKSEEFIIFPEKQLIFSNMFIFIGFVFLFLSTLLFYYRVYKNYT